MDWETQFAAIEDEIFSAHILQRDKEVADLITGEWSTSRLLDLVNGQNISVHLANGITFRGLLSQFANDWILVERQNGSVLISIQQIIGIEVAQLQIKPVKNSRWHWSHAFRWLQRQGEAVVVSRIDQSVVEGRIITVGKDYFALEKCGRSIELLPYRAVAFVGLAN